MEPKCPKCGEEEFDVKSIGDSGKGYALIVYCTGCGRIIGCVNDFD